MNILYLKFLRHFIFKHFKFKINKAKEKYYKVAISETIWTKWNIFQEKWKKENKNIKELTFLLIGILDKALCCGSFKIEMEKFAFIAGSSKQGKALRAEVASKWVVARYLKWFL